MVMFKHVVDVGMVEMSAEEEAAIRAEWAANAQMPPRLRTLSRPAFLFMMNKIGVTEAQVEALIAAMPSGSEAEADAKALALIVFRNQQTFNRDNPLLQSLTAAAGISDATVNAAWKAAESLVW